MKLHQAIILSIGYLLLPILLLFTKSAFSQTPCTMYGRVGTCSPAYLSNWEPSEEAQVAYEIETNASAGYTFTITSCDEWNNYGFSFGVPIARYRNHHGFSVANGCVGGPEQCTGIYGAGITQSREWRCPNPNRTTGYDVLGIEQTNPGPALCFTDQPSAPRALAIQSRIVTIPHGSLVQNGRQFTHTSLTLRLTENNKPVSGVKINLTSNRTNLDSLKGPAILTDSSGLTYAEVSTRMQPGLSVIKSTNTDIQTQQPASIQWLPALYERKFLITCYVIADENYSAWNDSDTTKKAPGLKDGNFKEDFLEDTKMQGTGRTADGKYIAFDAKKNVFRYRSEPLTSLGTKPIAGTTIAVDPTVIPYRSSVTVDLPNIGTRKAEDTGGRFINGAYKIDVFMGFDRNACLIHGKRMANVTLESY